MAFLPLIHFSAEMGKELLLYLILIVPLRNNNYK